VVSAGKRLAAPSPNNELSVTTKTDDLPDARVNYRIEALVGLAYLVLYLAYLFFNQESEALHWLTLVLLPLALLILYQRKQVSSVSLKDTLASVGLRMGNLRRGLRWAVLLGLALSVLQLYLSRHSAEIWELIRSGKAILFFPLVLLLMILTAGFTEEFFFRGVLQTRLTVLLRSKLMGITLNSVCFGIYHLPYAYLNEHWPSHGDWNAALLAGLGQAIPMGLILGILYERTRNNLVACVLLHSLVNSLPAMTMIKFHGP
jgi:membrane protease YdiL (CAAX protease family)